MVTILDEILRPCPINPDGWQTAGLGQLEDIGPTVAQVSLERVESAVEICTATHAAGDLRQGNLLGAKVAPRRRQSWEQVSETIQLCATGKQM